MRPSKFTSTSNFSSLVYHMYKVTVQRMPCNSLLGSTIRKCWTFFSSDNHLRQSSIFPLFKLANKNFQRVCCNTLLGHSDLMWPDLRHPSGFRRDNRSCLCFLYHWLAFDTCRKHPRFLLYFVNAYSIKGCLNTFSLKTSKGDMLARRT